MERYLSKENEEKRDLSKQNEEKRAKKQINNQSSSLQYHTDSLSSLPTAVSSLPVPCVEAYAVRTCFPKPNRSKTVRTVLFTTVRVHEHIHVVGIKCCLYNS
jgi:hypothetical protein